MGTKLCLSLCIYQQSQLILITWSWNSSVPVEGNWAREVREHECGGLFFVVKHSRCSSFSGAGSHTGTFAPEGKTQDFSSNRHARASLDCDRAFGFVCLRGGVSCIRMTNVDQGKRQTLGFHSDPRLFTLSWFSSSCRYAPALPTSLVKSLVGNHFANHIVRCENRARHLTLRFWKFWHYYTPFFVCNADADRKVREVDAIWRLRRLRLHEIAPRVWPPSALGTTQLFWVGRFRESPRYCVLGARARKRFYLLY